jgi:hypothetical protein
LSLEVIEAGDPAWEATLARAPDADVFHRPEYAAFRSEGLAERLVMLRFEDERGLVFDVTTVKEIARRPFFADVASEFSRPPIDLASPEYNGPLVESAPADVSGLMRSYRAAVDDWCREAAVVTEFVRLHPRSQSVESLGQLEPLVKTSEQVYVDLRGGYQHAFSTYRRKLRQQLRNAARRGVEVVFVEPDAERLATFVRLYSETLRRRAAKSIYPASYFASLFQHLRSRALLVEARARGEVASSTVFLAAGSSVWALYSGTVPDLFPTYAHKYMYDRVVAWAAERGFQYVMFGGGLEPGDGLYFHKQGYSSLSAPVHHLRKVHDPVALRRLLEAKAASDRRQGRQTRDDYFPAYWLD